MTRDPARGRGARDSERGLPLSADTLLLAIVIVGVLLRAFIAGIWLPHSGFGTDIGDFSAWAQRLAQVGPGGFYETGVFSDYPPGYLYVLWGLGQIGRALQPLAGIDITGGLLKIPPILADGASAWLIFLIARRLGSRLGAEAAAARIGVVAAVLYLFNPGTLFDSAVWGQVDSVGTLAVLGTVYLLVRGWTEAAAVGAVIALLVKFQFAFMIPIVFLVGIKRHAIGRSADPEQDGRPDALRVLTSLAAGLGSLVLLIAPFGLSVWAPGDANASLVGKFLEAASTYHGLTINAFNLWMNPISGLANPLSAGGLAPSLTWGDDQTVILLIGSFGVTWQLVGIGLFLAVAGVAAWAVLVRDDDTGILVATMLVAVAFFVLPTRVHERYLFPALALGAPLAARGARWALLYVVLSISFFANIYGVYTADWSFVQERVLNPGMGGLAMVRESILNGTLLAPAGIYLLSALSVVILAWLAVLTVEAVREGRLPARAPSGPASTGASLAPSAPWTDGEGTTLGPLAVLDTLRGWLRADRSHPLFRDPPRRLDRIDLVLVVAFVLLAFGYRLWRLDLPRSMHFDEVYHARSATEWLADWEHGWTRDVYEWTHPMLAKYLIAAGIEIADPNKVVGSSTLAEPSAALAVAPRRASVGALRSVAFTARGSSVVASDALSGASVASWDTGAAITALAYSEDPQRLFVGSATGGEVRVYDLATFLSAGGERAPPPQLTPIASGLRAVDQILVPQGASLLVLRGPDGISAVEPSTGASLARSSLVAAGIAYVAGTGGQGDASVLATTPATRQVHVLDAAALTEREGQAVTLPSTLTGPMIVVGTGFDQQAWVGLGPLTPNDEHPATTGGLAVLSAPSLTEIATVALPGPATQMIWQPIANVVYAAGTDATGQPRLWTIQALGDSRSGFAAFDTTALPGTASALALDISDHAQADDDGRLLAATTGTPASLVVVDAGSNAFGWRLMGIVFGAILVALIYLLAATMFRRRGVAILAAAFVTFDGMSYVMSRIGMNDIYVAVFIVAAYLVFWQIWSGRWARSAWWALPLVGLLIGLAAATKWVGWYALAGLLILVLARSALGRFVLVGAIGFLAVVAGIGAPWPFLVVCLGALALALALAWARPVRLASADLMALPATGVVLGGVGLAFALAYGSVKGRNPTGPIELLFSFLARGTQAAWPAWFMVGVAAALIAWRAAASLRDPSSDRRWMQPAGMAGFAWPWVGACLVVIPLVVYFVVYIPYLQLGHSVALAGGPGYGWSLDELQVQMFTYHFGLQAGHPAASPWWSWPLDLKPVWFYGSPAWDGRMSAAIYNGGNPILFWAGIPAILACSVLAWRRRSPALVLVVAAFAFQYLPWTRIERATFQYHYFTAVLFAMVAVAYLVDEALRNRAYQALGIAFLVAAGVVAILIWPLGAAWPMPDWYLNAARALPPWNYSFKFPDPPQGPREQLISANGVKLAVGTVVGLAAAAFSLWGRDRLVARRAGPADGRAVEPSAAPGARGSDEQHDAEQDDRDRPQLGRAQPGHVVPDQEPQPDQDQEGTEHEPGPA